MENLVVEIELMSEAIFGNGEASTSFVDVEILKDDSGIPYFKGKTFKGKLREEVREVSNILFSNGDVRVERLFGSEYSDKRAVLRFSDCKLNKTVKESLELGLKENLFTKEELTSSFTDVRSFTKLDEEGIAENGSLRQARVIKKGLKLFCEISLTEELTNIEKGVLAAGINSLRNLGAMESRGKGHVICRLKERNQNVTLKYIEVLKSEVYKGE